MDGRRRAWASGKNRRIKGIVEEFDEYQLDAEELSKIQNRQQEAADASRTAARVGMDLVDLIVKGVVANQKAQEAQADGKKILERVAKARGRQWVEIADLDINNKKILFRKRGNKYAELDGQESSGSDAQK